MGPRSIRRGNANDQNVLIYLTQASMGPRSIRRGNSQACLHSCPSLRCFNGATLNQAWKLKAPKETRETRESFNGATLNQAWKLLEFSLALDPNRPLQWGHAQSGVETSLQPFVC